MPVTHGHPATNCTEGMENPIGKLAGRRIGRPLGCAPLLTEELIAKVEESVFKNLQLAYAADELKVARSTFFFWRNRGYEIEAQLAEDPKAKIKKDDLMRMEFAFAIRRGLQRVETTLVDVIRSRATDGDWKAAAWVLSRRFRKRWSDAIAAAPDTGDKNSDQFGSAVVAAAKELAADPEFANAIAAAAGADSLPSEAPPTAPPAASPTTETPSATPPAEPPAA